MPIDTETPGSAGWWLARLGKQLVDKRPRYDALAAYARGDHPLPETTNAQSRQAFAAFQKKARTNYPALISGAVRELLMPMGFRTTLAQDERGDAAANRIWQANSLDADGGLVHGTALDLGDAYVIVGPVDDETGEPVITPEDPRQVVAETDPVRPRKTRAALKMYRDAVDGIEVAYLYLPGDDGRIEVHRAVRDLRTTSDAFGFDAQAFDWDGDVQVLDVTRNPVVRFRNRPQIDGSVIGEFEDALDMVDRINHLILDRLVIATMQAFRQRALKGDLPETDAEGNPIDWNTIFAPGPDALWNLPDGVDLWESQQVDLSPILRAVQDDVQSLGAVTRTPAYYLTGNMEYAKSGTAQLARLALESKAIERMREFGESWEIVMALAFAFKGDEQRSNSLDLETIWTPPQRYSLTEVSDAVSKLNGVVPWRTLMTDVYQASPMQLDRMESERAAALFFEPAEQDVTPNGNGTA